MRLLNVRAWTCARAAIHFETLPGSADWCDSYKPGIGSYKCELLRIRAGVSFKHGLGTAIGDRQSHAWLVLEINAELTAAHALECSALPVAPFPRLLLDLGAGSAVAGSQAECKRRGLAR